ncbi:MAG: exo-beta-N-acetylmuramidase NamZ family protein [Pyrinomonadaceae bacterium]
MVKLQRKPVKLGLEKVLENPKKYFGDLRVGLICNQATVNHEFRHAADLFFEHPEINLAALFGPQHGIRGDVQDNMVETSHATDKITKRPIYSLYSETREPTESMTSGLDALVFDLQDVGCRVYTFIYTMANAMRACAKYGKKMFVLDRPNPINGRDVEGNILEIGHESFVGMYPIPMRHGLTAGELAKLFNVEFSINCELEVVVMDEWSRGDFYDETDAPWVMPSPNMPTNDTAVVFPGTVYFEGTQVSEGRGTTRPFEIIGASFINSKELADHLNQLQLGGVIFRAVEFMPTFQKFAGKACGGVFIHVTDREVFKPVITGIAMSKTIFDMYPDDFKWKVPPYEYVYDRNPFDVIHGSTKLREAFEQGIELGEIEKSWNEDLKGFKEIREKYLLY